MRASCAWGQCRRTGASGRVATSQSATGAAGGHDLAVLRRTGTTGGFGWRALRTGATQHGQVAPIISHPGAAHTIVLGLMCLQHIHGVAVAAAVVVPLHFGHLPAGAWYSGCDGDCDWSSGWVGCEGCSCDRGSVTGGVTAGTNGDGSAGGCPDDDDCAWRWRTGGG